MDEELWDVLEDGVGDLKLDEEGAALDRKAHTAEQKKLYKKHHTIRGILVAALPHKEYLKMSDKLIAKSMFTSLCSLYEGNNLTTMQQQPTTSTTSTTACNFNDIDNNSDNVNNNDFAS